jgi:hypothetical protein
VSGHVCIDRRLFHNSRLQHAWLPHLLPLTVTMLQSFWTGLESLHIGHTAVTEELQASALNRIVYLARNVRHLDVASVEELLSKLSPGTSGPVCALLTLSIDCPLQEPDLLPVLWKLYRQLAMTASMRWAACNTAQIRGSHTMVGSIMHATQN